VADFWLPPPAAPWRPAAAVSVHFPLPLPPAVKPPAATDSPARFWVVGTRPVADSWPPPVPATWSAAAAVSV